jgi:rubrerythrin
LIRPEDINEILNTIKSELGVNKYTVWGAYRKILNLLGWKVVDRCQNYCSYCDMKFESLVVDPEKDFFYMCPKCNLYTTIEIRDEKNPPRWIKEKAMIRCGMFNTPTEFLYIEIDIHSIDIVRIICPLCYRGVEPDKVPQTFRNRIHEAITEAIPTILDKIKEFYDPPKEVINTTRWLLNYIDLDYDPLSKIIGAVELSKILLNHLTFYDYERFLRKRYGKLRTASFSRSELIDKVVYTAPITIYEDPIYICSNCGHTKLFVAVGDKKEPVCPKCRSKAELRYKKETKLNR